MSDATISYMGQETEIQDGDLAIIKCENKTLLGDVSVFVHKSKSNLAYILESTNDTTDRTQEIVDVLNQYGVCQLGKGVFYVGNLNMPASTTIQGYGRYSIVKLNPSIKDGYAVQINAACTIQDLAIEGNDTSFPTSVGTAHGIILKGTASEGTSFAAKWFPTITNCLVQKFSGGGITCHDTGAELYHGLNVTNCKIYLCGAGINIDFYSEYHRFTNVACYSCFYGCRNNGGNNIFTNCSFSGNTNGMLIQQSRNGAHGSAIGCILNHNKQAIKLEDITLGYVFQGCQVFSDATNSANIDIINSQGIVFDGIIFGTEIPINIYDGGLIMFTNCAFATQYKIKISNNEHIKMFHCYTWAGAQVGSSVDIETWEFTVGGEPIEKQMLINKPQ